MLILCNTKLYSWLSAKGIFEMKKYLYQFNDSSVKHKLNRIEKLIVQILCCGADVCGFIQAPAIEWVYLRFLKTILSVKTSTPHNLAYAELASHIKRLVQLLQLITG